MKKILVTGGAGFIGSNLIRELLPAGQHQVICLDNFDPCYSRRQKEMNIRSFGKYRQFRLIEGDVCNPRDLARIGTVDTVVHLAAKTGVRHSLNHGYLYDKVNVEGTRNLLEYARQHDIRQFVFASSSSIYGEEAAMPWRENGRINPGNPYAMSKFAAETLGELYSYLYGIRFLALRFFTVYGPAQRPDQAIHDFFDLALQGKPVSVFGDGGSSRDYTFVSDVVAGIRSAMDYEGSGFEIINLGNGCPVTLQEVIAQIRKICGREVLIEHCPEQPGDVRHTCADISKARQLLAYRPAVTLPAGIKAFYNWFMVYLAQMNAVAGRKVA
jgi:UDP-glucuronate 4-epimerase